MPPEHDDLLVYVVYDSPSDYPDHIVVRIHRGLIADPNPFMLLSKTALGRRVPETALMVARSFLQQKGLICIVRSPSDDPVIVESWI